MKKARHILLTVAVLTLMLSCTSPARLQESRGPLPAAATPAWRSFFGDSILVALIDTALRANPDLLIAYQRMEIASAEYSARHFALLPRVDGRAALGRRRFGSYTMDGVGNYDTRFSPNISSDQIIPEHLPDFFLGIQSSWEIDIWRKLRNGREAAKLRYMQQAEARNWVISNLVSSVASTYYELLALDRELSILDEFIRLQQNAELIISYQKLAGQANELAVQQFRAQTLSSQNMRVETQQRIVDAENRINYLLGRFPQPVPRNSAAFADSLTLRKSIPAELVSLRPDVREAELALRESGLNVAAARAAFYPSLQVDALLGLQSFNPGFVFNPASITYNLVAGLVQPLLNRAPLKAGLRIAGASQRSALLAYRKAVLGAYTEVATELAHIRNLEEMYAFKKAEASVSSTAVETADALFRTGRATYLEVIITQKNALMTNVQLADLRERQLKAHVRLYKSLGGGWR